MKFIPPSRPTLGPATPHQGAKPINLDVLAYLNGGADLSERWGQAAWDQAVSELQQLRSTNQRMAMVIDSSDPYTGQAGEVTAQARGVSYLRLTQCGIDHRAYRADQIQRLV